jgi:hypothetical protein
MVKWFNLALEDECCQSAFLFAIGFLDACKSKVRPTKNEPENLKHTKGLHWLFIALALEMDNVWGY